MTYADFRKSISNLGYVDDIYVEIRDLGAGDKIVAFFDINDTCSTPASMGQAKANAWSQSTLRQNAMTVLQAVHPAYLVFCDEKMSEFHVHQTPSDIAVFQSYTESAYINFLQSLGGAVMSNKQAHGPKYPQSLPPYSRWHYKLDWACKCRDIDYLEIRDGNIHALLEITGKLQDEKHLKNSISSIFGRWSLHQMMFRELTQQLNSPAFFVIHTTNLNVFYVFDLNFAEIFVGDQTSYIAWLNQI